MLTVSTISPADGEWTEPGGSSLESDIRNKRSALKMQFNNISLTFPEKGIQTFPVRWRGLITSQILGITPMERLAIYSAA